MITAHEAKALLILAEESSTKSILCDIEKRINTAIEANRSLICYKCGILIPLSVVTELKNLGYNVFMDCYRNYLWIVLERI